MINYPHEQSVLDFLHAATHDPQRPPDVSPDEWLRRFGLGKYAAPNVEMTPEPYENSIIF